MKDYRMAVVYILFWILIAHLAADDAYVWYQHSISQLAGQGYAQAWIMRLGFIGFGILLQIAGLYRLRSPAHPWFQELPLLLYGLCILASGIYSAPPFMAGVPFSVREAALHTLFATAAGWSLTAALLLHMLSDRHMGRKPVHAAALALTIMLSGAFFLLPAISGAFQVLLWLVGFTWLGWLGPPVPPVDAKQRAVYYQP